MHLHRSPSGLVVHAPGKLNLFFEVIAERDDGFHEIETLVYPIDLYDTLYFRETPDGSISLGCKQALRVQGLGGGHAALPEGEDNLVVRAVRLLKRRAGVAQGATIRLVKRIPSEAGLGGGSSDAAAALVAANTAWRVGWSMVQLARLGGELGSDVPLFFAQGAAACRGRGERVQPLAGASVLHFVVIRPPAGLSTAAVYGACRVPREPRPMAPLERALVAGDVVSVGELLFNRLESTAKELSPWVDRLQGELARADLPGHLMTGSGTCCFGLCRTARHARRVAGRLQARGIGIAYAVRGSR
jgi:4-diphosphocytidyl-2-C-methyl-D-erythritol kinase